MLTRQLHRRLCFKGKIGPNGVHGPHWEACSFQAVMIWNPSHEFTQVLAIDLFIGNPQTSTSLTKHEALMFPRCNQTLLDFQLIYFQPVLLI